MEKRVVLVFLAENHLLSRDLPIDMQCRVGEKNTAIRFWVIEVVAFVGKHRAFAQHRKTMCKTTRDIELTMTFGIKFYREVLPVGGATLAQVHRYIQNAPFSTTNQLGLGIWRTLEM